MIKSLNTSLFSFGTVTLLLFSEAFRSLSAGERRASSYASLRAGSRLSRFPAGVERCFSKQRNISHYYFNHAFLYNKRINVQVVPPMISNQETLNLSPYMAIYDIVVPKDNILRQINELVDFSFILEELKTKYCLDNGRNAIPPIRMFKYLLLKAIYDVRHIILTLKNAKYVQ